MGYIHCATVHRSGNYSAFLLIFRLAMQAVFLITSVPPPGVASTFRLVIPSTRAQHRSNAHILHWLSTHTHTHTRYFKAYIWHIYHIYIYRIYPHTYINILRPRPLTSCFGPCTTHLSYCSKIADGGGGRGTHPSPPTSHRQLLISHVLQGCIVRQEGERRRRRR